MKKIITFLTLLTVFVTTAWAGTVTDVLSYKTTGITGSSYSSFSGKKATSDAVYAGYCAGYSNTIQLNTGNGSGIITTASGGKVKKITITTWHNPASGIKLIFFGKNTPYSAASDLTNVNKQGTILGYIEYNGSHTLTIEGDYAYVGFRSSYGLIYIKDMTIEWEVPLTPPTISLSPSAPYFDGDEVTANMTTTETGASIIYKLNDGEWTEYDSNNPPTFSTTTAIQAKTVVGDDESEVTTETATFGPSCSIVSEMLALPDNTVFKFRGNLVVSGKSATEAHLYAQDASGGVHFRGTTPDYATEDLIPPGFIATKKTYNGALELEDMANMREATATGELNAVELTPSQVTQNNPFIYAVINNALIEQSGQYLSINVNGETVSLQETFPDVETPIVGKTYNIYGVTNWNNDPRFMPLAFEEVQVDPGDGYYLVGNFNMESDGTTWIVKDARYKFTEENGNYVLNANLPNVTDGVFFKIVHVDGNSKTWYGGEAGDYYGITKTVNSDIELKTGDNGKNFKINIGGPTNFTINPDNNNLYLSVSRDALLYYKGDNNNWVLAPMTATDEGWTTSQVIAANGRFGFADEWGDHHGGSGEVIYSTDYNNEITMTTTGDFIMEAAGDYLLIVNSALSTLIVEAPHGITCTAISDVPNGHDEQSGFKPGGDIVAKIDGNIVTQALPGEIVTLDITPWNGYTLHSVTVNDEEITPANGVYSFEMPNAAVEVIANFYAGGYPITVDSPHGTYNGPYSATVGETVEFNISDIEDGYRIIGITATFTNNNGGTTSVTVKKGENGYSFGMPPFPVNVKVVYKHHSAASGIWNLVTDATQLEAGKEYIIVYQDADEPMVMSATQNRNNRGAISILLAPDYSQAAITSDETQVFTLEGDATGWYFNAGDGYLYAASSTSNWLRTGQLTDNAKAAISITDGVADIVFQGANTRNNLRFNANNGSPLFSCYAGTSEFPKVSLYTRGEVINPNPPEFWPEPEELMPEDFYVEVWSEYEDQAAIYCIVDPSTPPTDPYTLKNEGTQCDYGWGWGEIFVSGPGPHTIYAVVQAYGAFSEIVSVTYNTYAIGDWKLVTNNRDLFVGQYEYIIVNDDFDKVVGAYDATGKNFDALLCENNVTFDPTFETATVNSDEVKIFSLEYVQGSGSWREGYLYDADGTYYHAVGHVSNWDENPPAPAIENTQGIVWAYNGGHTGYVYLESDNSNIAYNTVDGVFDCHNWNYPLDDHHTRIRLYYRAKPISLADLCRSGELRQEYTISDELIAVACAEDDWGNVYLWCKDQELSINPTYNTNDYEDFMTENAGFNGDWDQSNWIALRFSNGGVRSQTGDLYSTIKEYVGYKIKPLTVKGVYSNKTNYVLDMSSSSLETNGRLEYPLNLYCPANFLQDNLDGQATGHTTNTADRHYFFMNPKIQEVCSVTYAVWDGEKFVLPDPATGNPANIYGAFNVGWDFNNMYAEDPQTGDVIYNLYEDLVVGAAYKFKAIVQRPAPAPKAAENSLRDVEPGHNPGSYTPDGSYMVYPFDFDPKSPENIITAVSNVNVGSGQVKSVKYVNVTGIVSDRPFEGVNIVVTEYTDGSKVVKKIVK